MIKILLNELIKAEVPDREIARYWEILLPIGSALQEGIECEVNWEKDFFGEGLDRFDIVWYKYINNAFIRVEFDLIKNKIYYSVPIGSHLHNLRTDELTKDTIYQHCVIWFYMMTSILEKHRTENRGNL